MKRNVKFLFGFVILILFSSTCASTPMETIEINERYRGMLSTTVGTERGIDTVSVRGSTSFVCRDPQHNVTPQQILGTSYQVSVGEPQSGFLSAIFSTPVSQRSADRHDHEPIIDQLLNEARRQYPRENVNIRNARTGGHIPSNPRREEYQESIRNNDGSYSNVTRTRMVWDCFPNYVADVVVTQPMPQAVTHSLDISASGVSREDIFRRAHNWLTDTQRIQIPTAEAANMLALGRIQASHTFRVTLDHTYIIVSDFTIDVHDSRAVINFSRARMQTARPLTGNDIFLQSIANAAQAELVSFSNTLRAHITTR